MNSDTIGLFLLIDRLLKREKPLGRATILPLAEIKLPDVARKYDALVQQLFDQQLAFGDVQVFWLTTRGLDLVQEIAAQHSLTTWFYNEYYQAVHRSPAHATFCDLVYGENLCQHGVADMAQIRLLLDELHIQAGMLVLDFGCGDGRISEYISDTTGATVCGVDIADQGIRLALKRTGRKRRRMHFRCADIERPDGGFPEERFDRILVIDSLYFVHNQPAVIQALYEHLAPGGKMGLFYHCPPEISSEETLPAQTFKAMHLSYTTHDLSAQNRAHWLKKRQVLQDLEPLFEKEGSHFLFKNRLAECDSLDKLNRYLFIVNHTSS
jgi:2-polyprenyl-3-methyl-5-hydroxy-6-metoxy-1,4-benzoquinol methylase